MPPNLARYFLVINRQSTATVLSQRAGSLFAMFHCQHKPTISHCCRHQTTHSHATSNRDSDNKFLRLTPNLVDALRHNVNCFNQQYERVFGIAEIREMQSKVLKAESEFVEVTQRRKACQDKIEHFKDEIKGIRDKLEMTPRQSDNYLKLITQEHSLLREQLSLDVQLTQFKEREQILLENLSKLLRQSHELERLRQERAKYWQIISITLSLAGSLVALIAQRVRSQKSVMNQLATFDVKLQEIDESIKRMHKEAELQYELNRMKMDNINSSLDEIATGFISKNNTRPQSNDWFSWLPGLASLKSWTFGHYT